VAAVGSCSPPGTKCTEPPAREVTVSSGTEVSSPKSSKTILTVGTAVVALIELGRNQ
jgi:hypothetical protein